MALRERAARATDAKISRRLLAIALVLEGWSRRDAAEACAMDRQTLRDWVHRYNGLGPEGLGDAPRRNGPPPRLSASQQAQIAAWVRQGPDLERDGVVRWRCVDLQRRIKAATTEDSKGGRGGGGAEGSSDALHRWNGSGGKASRFACHRDITHADGG
jgi:transposase